MGVGLNLALLKENKSGDPQFSFLNSQTTVHEIKTKNYDF